MIKAAIYIINNLISFNKEVSINIGAKIKKIKESKDKVI